MQTDPALPWGHEVEGGVIQLRDAVTKWDLIAGKIIPVFDVNDRKVAGQFVEYPSDNKIYIEVSSGLVYRLSIDEYPTNTLRLERTEEFPQSGTMFTEVEISTEDVPNLICSPALPWNNQSINTVIEFEDEITEQDLSSGKLVMFATHEQYGERQLTITVSSSITIYQGGAIIGTIARPISGHKINVQMQEGAANWPITKIERV